VLIDSLGILGCGYYEMGIMIQGEFINAEGTKMVSRRYHLDTIIPEIKEFDLENADILSDGDDEFITEQNYNPLPYHKIKSKLITKELILEGQFKNF
jgi:hypothetical protein